MLQLPSLLLLRLLLRSASTAVDLSVHNCHVLHLQGAFPDRLHAQEHPCITREAGDRQTTSVEQLPIPDRAFISAIQPLLALGQCF